MSFRTCYPLPKKIHDGVPSDRYQKLVSDLPRRQASLFMQSRTGHAPLNKHPHRIRSAGSPIYPACETREETVQHFVITCPAYRTPHDELRRSIFNRDDDLSCSPMLRDALRRSISNRAYHIRQLLTHVRSFQVHRSHQKTRSCIWKYRCRRLKGSEPTRFPRTPTCVNLVHPPTHPTPASLRLPPDSLPP